MGKQNEPLTESYYYILLCLYEGKKHGYAIMQRTAELTGGNVQIGSGTMYGATGNMIKKGWIAECYGMSGKDGRRRMYELTSSGRQILLDERERFGNLLKSANEIMGGH